MIGERGLGPGPAGMVGGNDSIEDVEWTRLEGRKFLGNVTTERHRCVAHLFILPVILHHSETWL